MRQMQKKSMFRETSNGTNGVLQYRQMLQSSLVDPIVSVTRRNCRFPTKISANSFQRLKKQNISGVIPMEIASKSRVLTMRFASHIPDDQAGLCATIFELNLRKWVHFRFSNKHDARPKESVRNRLRRKSGWHNDVFCEKCQI